MARVGTLRLVLGIIGAILGLIVGAPAGFAIGMAWLDYLPHSSAGREIGYVVGLVFLPLGAILGAVLGAILLGRRAARHAPTRLDRILLIFGIIVAALAVVGFVEMRNLAPRA
jgi:hypothetical protein